jgi:enterochelin esterase-like enzyme
MIHSMIQRTRSCLRARLVGGAGAGHSSASARRRPARAVAARRLSAHTVFDSSYKKPRRLWVYTPADYDAKAAPYPLIVAFDGAEYRDTMPLPWILDTLRAAKKAPAFVAVLVDELRRTGTDRRPRQRAANVALRKFATHSLGPTAVACDDRSAPNDHDRFERRRARLRVRGVGAS